MKKFFMWVWGMLILFMTLFGVQDCNAVSVDYWYYRDSENQPCRDVEFVFARGSGQTRDTGPTYMEFKARMSEAASAMHASYRVMDLDYEAVAIRTDNVLGIYGSAGEAYDFGKSVDAGVTELWRYYNSRSDCNRTYWVLSGYSQGAMVIAKALSRLSPSRVVYIPLFGDPKLYLPEGEGFNPPACRNQNLSGYRVYVPNCDTDNGILGARKPYEIDGFEGLMGLWCSNSDFICGSSKNPLRNSGHSRYVSNGSIRQAANIVKERLRAVKPAYVVVSSDKGKYAGFKKMNLSTYEPILSETEILIDLNSPLMLNVVNEDSNLNYEWLVGNMVVGSGPLLADYIFKNCGDYVVELRALSSSIVGSSFVVVHVVESMPDDNRLPPPVTTAIQRDGESFRVSWEDIPERAKYFGIRINDYFLGYSEASNGEIIITDVDFDDISAGCFWFTEEMDMGYPAEIIIERLGGEIGVVTSVSASPWQIIAIISLPFLGVLVLRAVQRLVRDFKRIKKRPQDKCPESVRREVGTALALGKERPCERL